MLVRAYTYIVAMGGEGGSVDARTVAEVAVSMRRLLAAINAEELTGPPAS